jgi:hypothetical protein
MSQWDWKPEEIQLARPLKSKPSAGPSRFRLFGLSSARGLRLRLHALHRLRTTDAPQNHGPQRKLQRRAGETALTNAATDANPRQYARKPGTMRADRAFSPMQITGSRATADPTVAPSPSHRHQCFLDNPRLVVLRQHRRPRIMNIAETKR